MNSPLSEAAMPRPRLNGSLFIALALASASWGTDAPAQKPSPSSVAPHQRVSRHVYGAPIQSPIVGRKALPKKKTTAKSTATGKARRSQKPHSDLDDPF
jgi:hypothetical protein